MILLCAWTNLSGQSKSNVELWNGVGVKYKLNKRFRLDLGQEYRALANPFQAKSSFTEIGLRFKANKWLYIKPGCRFIRMPEINKDRRRYHLDLIFRLKPGDFVVNYRLRGQYLTTVNTNDRGIVIRNKLGVSYNLSKMVDPQLSWELFSDIEAGMDQRFKLSLEWRLAKRVSLDSFYALERQMHRKSNDNTHIIGLELTLNTGIKKKKKKKKNDS